MKKFMVVWREREIQGAVFFDTYREASAYRMNVECGINGYAEIYTRERDEDGVMSYQFLES